MRRSQTAATEGPSIREGSETLLALAACFLVARLDFPFLARLAAARSVFRQAQRVL